MSTRTLKSWVLRAGLASSVGLATLPVFAMEPQSELKLVQVGEVQYMSGGASAKERAVLEDHSSDFHVRVNFVGKSGKEQPRRVAVTLTNRDEPKSVIRLHTAGPILLMSLPTGHYTLSALVPGSTSVQSEFEREPGKIEELRVVLDTTPVSASLSDDAAAQRR